MPYAEKVLKNNQLVYKVLVANQAFEIQPKHFTNGHSIVLIENPKDFEMFLYDGENAIETHKFNYPQSIMTHYRYFFDVSMRGLYKMKKL